MRGGLATRNCSPRPPRDVKCEHNYDECDVDVLSKRQLLKPEERHALTSRWEGGNPLGKSEKITENRRDALENRFDALTRHSFYKRAELLLHTKHIIQNSGF